MLKWILTTWFGLFLLVPSYAQLKKFYSLQEKDNFDIVDLTFEAPAGSCHVKSSSDNIPLTIYGNPDLNRINPTYAVEIKNNTCFVNLELQEFRTASAEGGFSFSGIFGKNSTHDHSKDHWEMYLAENKIYDLNLVYGIGEAFLDFAGASVKNVNITTGNANVLVDYSRKELNPVKMDTFRVKVELGSLEARKINYMNAENILAEISFGSASLDFESGFSKGCNVKASVGAGTLDVLLPRNNTPVIIRIKDSPMCGIQVAEGYEEVEDNIYVNRFYSPDAENLMMFDVEVAVGKITFR